MIEPFLSFSSFSHLISLPDCRHVTRGPGVKWESESIGSKAGPVWKVWLKKKQALIIQSLSMTLGDTVYCPSQVTTTLHSTQHYTPPHPTTTPPHASTHHYTTSTRLHTPPHHLHTPTRHPLSSCLVTGPHAPDPHNTQQIHIILER